MGSPAIVGSFVAHKRRGGSEDPWLCVTSFGWFCLYRDGHFAPLKRTVNSEIYLNWPQFGFDEAMTAAEHLNLHLATLGIM
jgi:hypothetical protein